MKIFHGHKSIVVWSVVLACFGISMVSLAQAPAFSMVSFAKKPDFTFLSWDNKVKSINGAVNVITSDAQGGMGYVGQFNFSEYGDRSPLLNVTINTGNKMKYLRLLIKDADETEISYRFKLDGKNTGEPVDIFVDEGASLKDPWEKGKPGTIPGFDMAKVLNIMIIGDWSSTPVNITMNKLELAEPTAEVMTARTKLKERLAAEEKKRREDAEAKEKRKQEILKNCPHPADGAVVSHICTVAPDILSITLHAGKFTPNQLIPFEKLDGDEIVEIKAKTPHYIVKDGELIQDTDKVLYRKIDGKRTMIGDISPDGKYLFKEGKTTGQLLEEIAIDDPAAFTIQSDDDPAYAKAISPSLVYRKGKPDGYSKPFPFVYYVSLQLPTALKEGSSYTIRFVGVNTVKETATFTYNPRKVRSDAVHAIQTGYRPDDPYKRAYLSIWLGQSLATGKTGGYAYNAVTFELIDAKTGKTVYTGKPELTKAIADKELLNVNEPGQDYTLTAVHKLDFSGFNTPGEYCVYVPGIGTSDTFKIAANVWEQPFKTVMTGILTQRQGIELGPPMCDFKRARTYHPDDGVEYYQLTITERDGQEGTRGNNMLELIREEKLEKVTGIWGGYQDAGDWDTLARHMDLTTGLFELYEMAPEYFNKLKLSLPKEEMENKIPDLLDEAMWQMPCFKRLQLPDGSVRGGYGDGWGARKAQISSMPKFALVYGPDQVATYRFAGASARVARVMAAFDKKLADEYLTAAKKAWKWAEEHSNDNDPLYKRLSAVKGWPSFTVDVKNNRNRAAVELYSATKDQAYHDVFKQTTELTREDKQRYIDMPDADFIYACLPDELADKKLKQRAIDLFTNYADYAIDFSKKNGFEIINGHRTDVPIIGPLSYFSTPAVKGAALIRAYALTKKTAYLAAAVQGCNYSLGANPDNLSYCTGVGKKSVKHPFKLDTAITGQYPGQPVGYIPYGQGNEANAMSKASNGWVYTWHLNFDLQKKVVPDYYSWPANEMYVDFGTSPMMTENTLDSNSFIAAYYWGFLAAR